MNLKTQEAKIAALEQENQALRERIAELERRLGIDSQTSSKPPSSDGLKKKNTPRTRSLRSKSKRKTGGQKGHQGQTLEQVSEPDKIINYSAPDCCSGCGCDVSTEQVLSVLSENKTSIFWMF